MVKRRGESQEPPKTLEELKKRAPELGMTALSGDPMQMIELIDRATYGLADKERPEKGE